MKLMLMGILQEVSNREQVNPIPMIFNVNGNSFNPLLTLTNGAIATWTLPDASTMIGNSPEMNWSTSENRQVLLVVSNWNDVTEINLGYDGADGGDAFNPTATHHPTQLVTSIENLNLVKDSLQAFYVSRVNSVYTQITNLNFTNFSELITIECYNTTSLVSIDVLGTPKMRRICVEFSNITSLDVSDSPLLEDIRCARTRITHIELGTIGENIWHFCLLDNSYLTTPYDLSTMTNVRELWIGGSSGYVAGSHIVSPSKALTSVEVYNMNIGSLDVSNCPELNHIETTNNPLLDTLNITNCPKLHRVQLDNCNLSQDKMDSIIQQLANGIVNWGTFQGDGNNGTTNAAGITTLRSRDWTVNIEATPVIVDELTVSTISATSIDKNSALLTGNIIELGLETVTSHGFVYGETINPTIADNVIDLGVATSIGEYSDTVIGLVEDTTYYYKAYATNSVETVYGSEMSFKTEPEPIINDGEIIPNVMFDNDDYWVLKNATIENGKLKVSGVWGVTAYVPQADLLIPVKPYTDYILKFELSNPTQTGTVDFQFQTIGGAIFRELQTYNVEDSPYTLYISSPDTIYMGGFGFVKYGGGAVDINSFSLMENAEPQITHTITAITPTNGVISPAGNTEVVEGENLNMTITPNVGWEISDVLVNNVSVGIVSSYEFINVQGTHTISATFIESIIPTYTISSSSGSNGTITPLGVTEVNEGDSQQYTITPNSGFEVDDVLVDSVSVGAVSSYEFINIQVNHTISVTFKESTPPPAGGNMLYNGDFEIGGFDGNYGDVPKVGEGYGGRDYYFADGWDLSIMKVNTTRQLENFRVTGEYASQAQSSMLSPIKPNTTYSLEFDMYNKANIEEEVLAITFTNHSGIGTPYINQVNYDLGHHILHFTTGSDIGIGGFRIRLGYAYMAYLDNFVLTEVI